MKYAKNKHSVIKKILELDNRYTVDYMMTWTKKDLLEYYNKLIRKERKYENGTK
jgi:hypothetical protein